MGLHRAVQQLQDWDLREAEQDWPGLSANERPGSPAPAAGTARLGPQMGPLQQESRGWRQQRQQQRQHWLLPPRPPGLHGRQPARRPRPVLTSRGGGVGAAAATVLGSQCRQMACPLCCQRPPPLWVPLQLGAGRRKGRQALREASPRVAAPLPADRHAGSHTRLLQSHAPAATAGRRRCQGAEGRRRWLAHAAGSAGTRVHPAARAEPGCVAPAAAPDGCARLRQLGWWWLWGWVSGWKTIVSWQGGTCRGQKGERLVAATQSA